MTQKLLYLECESGIAGDMLVAALLDLGADENAMRAALESLPVDGFDITISRREKSGLDCCDFDVVLGPGYENHDHDMAWLHGDAEAHEHHHHKHEHDHEHVHHHEHRGLSDVLAIIDAAQMSEGARTRARTSFEILAEAEAKAHGSTPDTVHFHEVGALDSIVDIIAASVLLDSLELDGVIVPSLSDGTGTIRCAHGIIPVPVPATLNICSAHHIALKPTNVEGELVTPTGAALVAASRTSSTLPASYTVLAVGLGAGKRDYACPGFVRAMLVQPDESSEKLVWRLESDIDDSTPEALGHAMDTLLEAGAREVHYLPLFAKKSRPGWQLQVICTADKIERLEQIIFAETTTIGIRRMACERSILPRSIVSVDTSMGKLRVKEVTLPDGSTRRYPEYESVVELAEGASMSFQDAWQIAQAACATT